VEVIDAAFAGLPQEAARFTRVDAATDERDGRGREIGRHLSSAVVSQLATQLAAMDRQRDQLAQLLRDIEAPTLAD
jgi:hypothetical protein